MNSSNQTASVIPITHYSEGGESSAYNAKLVKISSNKRLVLWDIQEKYNALYRNRNRIGYAFVDGTDNLLGSIQIVEASLSDNEPVLCGNRVIWYYTDKSAPKFCMVNANTGEFSAAGGPSAQEEAKSAAQAPAFVEQKPETTPSTELTSNGL